MLRTFARAIETRLGKLRNIGQMSIDVYRCPLCSHSCIAMNAQHSEPSLLSTGFLSISRGNFETFNQSGSTSRSIDVLKSPRAVCGAVNCLLPPIGYPGLRSPGLGDRLTRRNIHEESIIDDGSAASFSPPRGLKVFAHSIEWSVLVRLDAFHLSVFACLRIAVAFGFARVSNRWEAKAEDKSREERQLLAMYFGKSYTRNCVKLVQPFRYDGR